MRNWLVVEIVSRLASEEQTKSELDWTGSFTMLTSSLCNDTKNILSKSQLASNDRGANGPGAKALKVDGVAGSHAKIASNSCT